MPRRLYRRIPCGPNRSRSRRRPTSVDESADELKHRLKLRDQRIADLGEQLEAYREVNDALRTDNRLLGMLAESDLQKIVKPTTGDGQRSGAQSVVWTGGKIVRP